MTSDWMVVVVRELEAVLKEDLWASQMSKYDWEAQLLICD